MAAKKSGRWVVYERQGDKFVFLSKLLKTKESAEKERLRLKELPEHRRSSIGVGFVRTVAKG
jgi:hypothetical protein